LAAGWLQPHKTSRAEIRELWEIVDRDLADRGVGRHLGRLAIAFVHDLRTEVLAWLEKKYPALEPG
jgi:hypothetical protein